MMKPTIGLLAGMGVRSTGPFLDLVIEECQRQYGARYETDYPPMIVYSLPVPFYPDRPVDHDAFREAVVGGLERLQGTGVDFIAVPCNSAHVYFDELRHTATVPLLNLVDEAVASLPHDSATVALLATRYTRDSGLFQGRLAGTGRTVLSDEDTQVALDRLLTRLRQVSDLEPLRGEWREILGSLVHKGADSALIACTDLNAVSGPGDDGIVRMVDGTRALASAVVRTWTDLTERA
jgi:aspartate racemase